MCKIIKVVKSYNSENYGKLRATFKGRSNVLGVSDKLGLALHFVESWWPSHGPCMRRAYKLTIGRLDGFDKPKN